MSRQTTSRVAWLMLALAVISGCSPTQPFYFHEDGDLSHYVDKANEMEYPDVCTEPLADTSASLAPMTVSNPDFKEMWDLPLEECMQITLQNSKTIRNLGGVTPFGFAGGLVDRGVTATVYDKAQVETTVSSSTDLAAGTLGLGVQRPVVADRIGGVEDALAEFDAVLRIAGDAGGIGGGPGVVLARNDRPSDAQPNSPIFPVLQDEDIGGIRSEIIKQSASGARFTMANQTNYERYNNNTKAWRALDSFWATSFEARMDYPLLRGNSIFQEGGFLGAFRGFCNDGCSHVCGDACRKSVCSHVCGPACKSGCIHDCHDECRRPRCTHTCGSSCCGGGTLITRIPIILARINEDKSLAGFELSVRNLVMDVENTYWELHRAYRNLETAKTGRDSAQVTWKIVYEKWNEGVEPVQAEAQAREQYFSFRAAVERSLQELYSAESRLRWLMGLAATDGRLIRPIDEPILARVDFDWCAIRTEALVRSAELREKRWTVKQRELELISARNQLLPQLDVGAVYKWVGKGDDLLGTGPTYPSVGSSAFQELAGGNYQEAAIFFNYTMPIGFRRAMANVRNRQLTLAKEKAILEDWELNVVHLLSTAIRNVDSYYVQAQTHFNRWSAAEKEVESVNALYKGGKQTVDLVLEAQRRRAQSQVDFYNALVEYNKAIAEVHFRKGSLLEYNNVYLTEGQWPNKAYWDALGLARQRDASYYLNYGTTQPAVVSRGVVPQRFHDEPLAVPTPAEMIPAPEPTPAGKAPADGQPIPESGPVPQALPTAPSAPTPEAGPVTGGPLGPVLNAPLVSSTPASPLGGAPDNPLRGKSLASGGQGLNSLRPSAAGTTPLSNTLRPAATETASPVQPAGYFSTVSDEK